MAHILIVEDDADLLFLYRTALMQQHHQTIEAENARDAMTWLSMNSFDVIILDLNLPDAHGSVVVDHMIHNGLHHPSKVIVITANDRGLEPLEERGVEYILIKPISVATVTELVKRIASL